MARKEVPARGEFTLKGINSNATLEISYVGYETKQVALNGVSFVTVRIGTHNARLSDVVIVSYGVQNRANVTGAISQLNASKVQDQAVGQFSQQLQGQFAGVQANINTGKPGQGIEIQIRGAFPSMQATTRWW